MSEKKYVGIKCTLSELEELRKACFDRYIHVVCYDCEAASALLSIRDELDAAIATLRKDSE